MTREEKIEQEVKKTLAYLDKSERLKSDSFFYTRLKARLDHQQRSKTTVIGFLKPAFIALLIAFNVITAIWYFKDSKDYDTAESHNDLMNVLADEFNLENNDTNMFILN